MTEDLAAPVPAAKRACQHLWLPVNNDAYENLRMLTLLSNPSPFAATMLAGTPFPHGSGATPRECGYIVRGLRVMGQTVCLLSGTDNHFQ